MTTDPSSSLPPSPPLTSTSTSDAGSQPVSNQAFVMLTTEWLEIQKIVRATLALGIASDTTATEFQSDFGNFSDTDEVVAAIDAIWAFAQFMDAPGGPISGSDPAPIFFGDPETALADMAEADNFLTAADPPDGVFEHILWVAQQVNTIATVFAEEFPTLGATITSVIQAAGTIPSAQQTEITRVLNAFKTQATTLEGQINALTAKLANFTDAVNAPIANLVTYFQDDQNILATAQGDVTMDLDNYNTYEEDAHEAWENWKKYTIAAASVAGGLMIISGGLLAPFAAAAGGGLGAKAAACHKAYTNYESQAAAAHADQVKKQNLVSQLVALNTALEIPAATTTDPNPVSPMQNCLTQFNTNLSAMVSCFSGVGAHLTRIINNYGPSDWTNNAVISGELDLQEAGVLWNNIATTAQGFISNSIIHMIEVNLGSAPPASDQS